MACKQCGTCCRFLSFRTLPPSDDTKRYFDLHNVRIGQDAIEPNKVNLLIFSLCNVWDPSTKRCKEYEKRPKICQEYECPKCRE